MLTTKEFYGIRFMLLSETKRIYGAVAIITPDIADAILSSNKNYRRLDRNRVERYANSLLDDVWEVNGESIKLDSNGRLLDGQHRLHAVIRANRNLTTSIVLGVNSTDEVDRGKPRNIADHFRAEGVKNATIAAAATAVLYRFHKQKPLYDRSAHCSPSVSEAWEIYQNTLGISDIVSATRKCRGLCATGALAGVMTCAMTASKCGLPPILKFLEDLSSGAGLNEDSPVYALRERLIRVRESKKVILAQKELTALIIIAWNHYAFGATLRKDGLRYRQGGSSPQQFPQLITHGELLTPAK